MARCYVNRFAVRGGSHGVVVPQLREMMLPRRCGGRHLQYGGTVLHLTGTYDDVWGLG